MSWEIRAAMQSVRGLYPIGAGKRVTGRRPLSRLINPTAPGESIRIHTHTHTHRPIVRPALLLFAGGRCINTQPRNAGPRAATAAARSVLLGRHPPRLTASRVIRPVAGKPSLGVDAIFRVFPSGPRTIAHGLLSPSTLASLPPHGCCGSLGRHPRRWRHPHRLPQARWAAEEPGSARRSRDEGPTGRGRGGGGTR